MAFVLGLGDTKNERLRMVPIHPCLSHVVQNPTLWPQKVTCLTVSKTFKAGARAAGFGYDAHLHDPRHSTASEIINAGVDLYPVGRVPGQKSQACTRRHSRLATKTLCSAVALLGRNPRTTGKKKAA